MKYGLWNQSSFFQNKYFTTTAIQPSHSLYDRQVTFRNLEMGTQQTYNFRQKFSSFFQAKTSIFRYNRWLVAIVQFYTPSLASKNSKTSLNTLKPFSSFNSRPVNLHSARIRWVQKQHSYSRAVSQTQYLF